MRSSESSRLSTEAGPAGGAFKATEEAVWQRFSRRLRGVLTFRGVRGFRYAPPRLISRWPSGPPAGLPVGAPPGLQREEGRGRLVVFRAEARTSTTTGGELPLPTMPAATAPHPMLGHDAYHSHCCTRAFVWRHRVRVLPARGLGLRPRWRARDHPPHSGSVVGLWRDSRVMGSLSLERRSLISVSELD
jgi:hypothetical protein